MKVFNLACEHDHTFEGWFASADDYDTQLARGLLECPICSSRTVRKLLSAPRLNLSQASEPVVPRAAAPSADAALPPAPAASQSPNAEAMAMQALIMKMARAIASNTEDVGERFADEARRIHYNEAPERGIRGVATAEQAAELADEGIEVMAFPMPASLKEPLQ
jgi:hypothetical protein